MRPNPPGAPTAAGYLSVTNTGRSPDRLIAVTTAAAQETRIDETRMAGGVMQMRPVVGGLEIAPGKTVTLAPGGYHVMFIRPKQAFHLGDYVPGTLDFEHAGKVTVEFYVEATEPASSHMAGMATH